MESLLDDYKVYAETIITKIINKNKIGDWFLISKPYKTYKPFNELSYDKSYYEYIDKTIINSILKNNKLLYEIKNFYQKNVFPIIFYDEYHIILF